MVRLNAFSFSRPVRWIHLFLLFGSKIRKRSADPRIIEFHDADCLSNCENELYSWFLVVATVKLTIM